MTITAAEWREEKIKLWSERYFQAQVLALARQLGYMVYHTYDSRRSEPGFPDLVMVKPGCPVLYRELKAEKGRTSEAQHRWLHSLIEADQDAAIWRPRDWLSGRIQQELGVQPQN